MRVTPVLSQRVSVFALATNLHPLFFLELGQANLLPESWHVLQEAGPQVFGQWEATPFLEQRVFFFLAAQLQVRGIELTNILSVESVQTKLVVGAFVVGVLVGASPMGH